MTVVTLRPQGKSIPIADGWLAIETVPDWLHGFLLIFGFVRSPLDDMQALFSRVTPCTCSVGCRITHFFTTVYKNASCKLNWA